MKNHSWSFMTGPLSVYSYVGTVLAIRGVLVGRVGRDRRRLERRERPPVVVVERVAERAGEQVAARLRDHVHHAAAEAAELRRHAADGDRRLLNRVLDVQVVRRAAEVLGDRHAVDHEQRFERRRAGNRVRAARAGRVHARRLQQRRVDVAVGRQRRDQLLLEVRRHLRGLRQHVGRLADDVDGFRDRRRTHLRIERQDLRRRERDRLRDALEAAQLDGWVQIVAPDRARDPSGYLAVRYSYPRWIVDAFRDALGPDAAETEDALAAGNARPAVVLALSPAGLPSDAAGLLPDGERTRWSPYGFRLAGGDPAPLVASGSRVQAAVQDEASQLAALALTRTGVPGRDELWLDLCAGPGGKARLLGGLAAARGARLVASDLHPHRARRVLDALNRSGGENHGVIAADGRQVPWPPGTFDRVLADVPCSGLGSLRRRPEARWRKTPGDVKALASLQRELLGAALDSARPGGLVAYVTCSPHLAETRDVVTAVTQARDDVTVLDAPAVLPEVPGLRSLDPRFAQFWPHRHGTDAIFLALLRRDASAAAEGTG